MKNRAAKELSLNRIQLQGTGFDIR